MLPLLATKILYKSQSTLLTIIKSNDCSKNHTPRRTYRWCHVGSYQAKARPVELLQHISTPNCISTWATSMSMQLLRTSRTWSWIEPGIRSGGYRLPTIGPWKRTRHLIHSNLPIQLLRVWRGGTRIIRQPTEEQNLHHFRINPGSREPLLDRERTGCWELLRKSREGLNLPEKQQPGRSWSYSSVHYCCCLPTRCRNRQRIRRSQENLMTIKSNIVVFKQTIVHLMLLTF